MTGVSGSLAYLVYTLGAIVCTISAFWLAKKGDPARTDRTPAIIALALTANWCFASASFDPQRAIVAITEVARNLGWIFVLFRLFGNDGRDETLRLVRPAVLALAFVELLQVALLLIGDRYGVTAQMESLVFETAATFRVMVAVGALVLLHNLYVGAADSSRRILRWNVAALGGLWAFDLNFYTVAYFLGSVPVELDVLRGAAASIVAIPFALGFNRGSPDLEFRPSREVAFRFLSLLVIGGYFAVMLIIARSLDMVTGDLARLTQVGVIIAAGALALIWLPSKHLRGWLRVTALKHFFKHRYDYRSEWIRFTQTMGDTDRESLTLQDRVVKVLADLTDSPSGILLVPGDDETLELAANWRWPTLHTQGSAASAQFGRILEQERFILDLDELRSGVDHHGERAVAPDWLLQDRKAWAAVPLIHFDRLVGIVILSRPIVERKLDWEDFDLLSVVGRQLASYLAEQAGQTALLEAGQFDEFNRRMAFVMHDVKNLSSQMSLLLRNAEKHADNPEFRKDMLVTLRSSADKLNAMLARLGRYGSPAIETVSSFELADLAGQVVARLGKISSVTMVRGQPVMVLGDPKALDQALVHLVQNAIDASPPESPVVVEVLSDGMWGKVNVIDSGHGMSPHFLRNGLFKPFVSSKSGSFGIGALESRELVRSMGGRLDVDSREGLGTRFTVSLPLTSAKKMSDADWLGKLDEVA